MTNHRNKGWRAYIKSRDDCYIKPMLQPDNASKKRSAEKGAQTIRQKKLKITLPKV